jgi:hypothetical protein
VVRSRSTPPPPWPVAGFAAAAAAESVDTPGALAGFDGWPQRPGDRTGTLAACRYALAVSRRTAVASSIRRSDHPSRPSAITCCRFSALKTLAIPAVGCLPSACVNVSAPGAALAGFQVSINGRIWVSTEVLALATAVVAAEHTPPTPSPAEHTPSGFTCGTKRTCGQMASCAEARFYLTQCGVSRLDADKDGIPCEDLCR